MQMVTVTVLMAAAAAAAVVPPPDHGQFGTRYTDHQCKTLHSLPNRDFQMDNCIEANTVGSIWLREQYAICNVFYQHQCKGTSKDGVTTPSGPGRCVDMTKGNWKGAVSFRCTMGNN